MAFSPETYALLKAQGGGGGGGGESPVLIIHSTFDESTGATTLDKTWNEIFSAITSDKLCVVFNSPYYDEPDYKSAAYCFVPNCYWEDGESYSVDVCDFVNRFEYFCVLQILP